MKHKPSVQVLTLTVPGLLRPSVFPHRVRARSFRPTQCRRERAAPFNASAVWITDRVEHRLADDSRLSHSVWLRVCTRQAQARLFRPSAQGDSDLPRLWVEARCGRYRLQRWTQSELCSLQSRQFTETHNVIAACAERSYYDNPAPQHG